MKFNDVLKEKRKALSLTQEQVAEKIFVSQKSISNWETGSTYPDIDSLIRLAQLYDLSLDTLLLEKSELVEDIKNQAELKAMKRMSLPPLITNIILILLLIDQKWWGILSEPASILILIGLFCNFIPMFYLKKQAYLLEKKEPQKLPVWLTVLFIILVAVVGAVLILLTPHWMAEIYSSK